MAFLVVLAALCFLMYVAYRGHSVILFAPIAALGAGLVGLFFGLPSLRVRGFYLAMATLAAQFIIPWLTRHIFPELLGGSSGRIEVPVPAPQEVRS